MPIGNSTTTLLYLRNLDHGDTQGVRYARSKLSSDSILIREAAARGLGTIGPDADSAVPELLIALHDTSSQVASSAAWALGNIQSPQRGRAKPINEETVDALVEALDHPNGEVRRYAAYGISLIGPTSTLAVPKLIERLNDQHMAYMAAQALGNMGPAARGSIPTMTTLLNSPHDGERAEAALALSKLGPLPSNTVGAIRRLQTDEVDFVREAARDALQTIASSATPSSPVK